MSADGILKLVLVMGAEEDSEVLLSLCHAAEMELTRRLKEGVTAKDCGTLFLIAGAWLVLDWMDAAGFGGAASFSAGDVSIKSAESGRKNGQLQQRALNLLAPYLKDERFAMQGVEG